jgi:CheY-like chemotaxis protein
LRSPPSRGKPSCCSLWTSFRSRTRRWSWKCPYRRSPRWWKPPGRKWHGRSRQDDLIIADDLKALIADLGHRVIGIARTQKEAVALAKKARPGLILADIQLADGSSGIDAVEEIRRETSAPVVFITAYPERLLTGEAREPTYLLSKPFDGDAVRIVVSQALFF